MFKKHGVLQSERNKLLDKVKKLDAQLAKQVKMELERDELLVKVKDYDDHLARLERAAAQGQAARENHQNASRGSDTGIVNRQIKSSPAKPTFSTSQHGSSKVVSRLDAVLLPLQDDGTPQAAAIKDVPINFFLEVRHSSEL